MADLSRLVLCFCKFLITDFTEAQYKRYPQKKFEIFDTTMRTPARLFQIYMSHWKNSFHSALDYSSTL